MNQGEICLLNSLLSIFTSKTMNGEVPCLSHLSSSEPLKKKIYQADLSFTSILPYELGRTSAAVAWQPSKTLPSISGGSRMAASHSREKDKTPVCQLPDPSTFVYKCQEGGSYKLATQHLQKYDFLGSLDPPPQCPQLDHRASLTIRQEI